MAKARTKSKSLPEPSTLVFSRAAIRAVDALARDRFGLPTIVLMENAGRELAQFALLFLDEVPRSAMIFCGPGNNGGDGYAAARHLHNVGVKVAILSTINPQMLTGDALTNAVVAERMGIPITRASEAQPFSRQDAQRAILNCADTIGGFPSIFIDALVGTGLDRPIAPGHAFNALIEVINSISSLNKGGLPLVIAADIPSGLDADTGKPLGTSPNGPDAMRADVTVTFAGVKAGFLEPGASDFTGRLLVADIGVPAALLRELADPPDRPFSGRSQRHAGPTPQQHRTRRT